MAGFEEKASPPNRLVFSSDALPPGLDDRARKRLWQEMGEALYASLEFSYADDIPFAAHVTFAHFGQVELGEFGGTLTGMTRTPRNIAVDGRDDFFIGLNFGSSAILHRQLGREAMVGPAALSLASLAETGVVRGEPGCIWRSVIMPRSALCELVVNPDDLVATPIDPSLPATRLLQRYVGVLLEPDGLEDDPAVSAYVSRTLVDLVALVLGAGRDTAEIAKARGLRAARLRLVLAEIKADYTDPTFSEGHLAAKLGLSPRYIRDLLHETGTTFSERVLELRLQSTRAMLSDPAYDRLKISEIAYACGFNEVSYFNRCFRRRFGASPTQFRGNGQSRN